MEWCSLERLKLCGAISPIEVDCEEFPTFCGTQTADSVFSHEPAARFYPVHTATQYMFNLLAPEFGI
jgi:hypothetical protein